MTVSPHTSVPQKKTNKSVRTERKGKKEKKESPKAKRFRPMTPATSGPVLIPALVLRWIPARGKKMREGHVFLRTREKGTKKPTLLPADGLHSAAHVQGKFYTCLRMVGESSLLVCQASHRHETIRNGLDFLDAELCV